MQTETPEFNMRIVFEKGSCQISREDLHFLEAIARNASVYEQYQVLVINHIPLENPGKETMGLSQKRAHAVVGRLKAMGLPSTRVDCETWKGEWSVNDSVQLLVFKLHSQPIPC